MLRNRSTKLTGVLLLVLLLAPGPLVLAGKGREKGKPGGGDGGSPNPPQEIAFLAWPEPEGSGGWVYGMWNLYGGTAAGDPIVRLAADGAGAFGHHGTTTQDLAFDPRGEVIAAADSYQGLVFVDPDTGEATVMSRGQSENIRWSRQRDAAGDLLPYPEQRIASHAEEYDGAPNPDTSAQVYSYDLFLWALDGSADDIRLTDYQSTWDPATQIFVRREAWHPIWIPEQPIAGLEGVAWVLYRYSERHYLRTGFDQWQFLETSSVEDQPRLLTLDVSDWSSDVVRVDSDVALTAPWASSVLSPDGRFAFLNENDEAYVIPVDYSGGQPFVPAPAPAAEPLAVTPPDGWLPTVEVRNVNADASLFAVNLYRMERTGLPGQRKTKQPVRHLFAVAADGSGLTQVDVETQDAHLHYAGYSASFREP